MKAERTDKGNGKRERFFMAAAFIFIVILVCGGGCSSRHAMTAPYELAQDGSGLVEAESVSEASYDGVEWDEGTDEDPRNVSEVYSSIGSEMFKVTEMLFAAVDSLGEISK